MLALLRGLVKQLHLSVTVVKNNCVATFVFFFNFFTIARLIFITSFKQSSSTKLSPNYFLSVTTY